MERVAQFVNMPFKYHLIAGTFIRLILILYGNYHDKTYDLPYTDVDYKVYTDAARHVINGDSPYKRHTYRYSPIVAYLMVPNILIGRNFGKILFSIFDILITIALKILVAHQLGTSRNRKDIERISMYCSLFWLYNPLSVGISTRGNADSVPCFFIILSILFLQTRIIRGLSKYVLSGVLLGISIHLRLYPLAFSFPMYLSLGNYKITRSTSIKDGFIMLMPNMRQIILALSCVTSLVALTYGMYILYGYEFLFETYIYHLFRRDTKHNFSLLFYYMYLTMDHMSFDIVKAISVAFECVILFVLSLTFGCDSRTLPFALFSQAVILVTYNSVMTSQYFVWFLSLLPLVVHDFKIDAPPALLLTLIWVFSQGAWLFYGYLLEFKCRDAFLLIWVKSVVFFCTNLYVLYYLIMWYTPGHGFGRKKFVSNAKLK